MSPPNHAALLIVDVQKDFCAGGALPVPSGDRIVEVLNRYIDQAVRGNVVVYASRDWHPPQTKHFKQAGGSWPSHCVQGTPGADFHPDLKQPASLIVIDKGTEPGADGYSAFEGTTPDGTPFLSDLRARGIDRLYVGGLATDYCVKHSVLDALARGFDVTVLEDATAGVDAADTRLALAEMRERGASVISNAAFGTRVGR